MDGLLVTLYWFPHKIETCTWCPRGPCSAINDLLKYESSGTVCGPVCPHTWSSINPFLPHPPYDCTSWVFVQRVLLQTEGGGLKNKMATQTNMQMVRATARSVAFASRCANLAVSVKKVLLSARWRLWPLARTIKRECSSAALIKSKQDLFYARKKTLSYFFFCTVPNFHLASVSSFYFCSPLKQTCYRCSFSVLPCFQELFDRLHKFLPAFFERSL